MNHRARRTLTARETAACLGLSIRTVRDRRWRQRAGVPATRVGGRLLFTVRDLDRALTRGRERLPRRPTIRVLRRPVALMPRGR